jgi:1-deoxy-D-xylulose-5-phosphate reductoisomerase
MKKRVAVLGATGSIGKNSLDVLRRGKDRYEAALFSAHTDAAALLTLAGEFPGVPLALSGREFPDKKRIAYSGSSALLDAIAASGANIAINGIAGAAGLRPSLAALEAGQHLALANKESIVMAGNLVLALAREKKVRVLPVDSEHAAVFALIEAHGAENVEEIILTASGGPFLDYEPSRLAGVSPAEALAHPTWNMGPKISVDSATLANKGLEVIEASLLFSMPPEKIRVTIHPQSVVHSMVRLKNRAVYAQLSKPDMRFPIQEALSWPEILPCPFTALDFDELTLEFRKPDPEKFPLLALAYAVARRGGLYPAVFNAANESAVKAFLEEKISFLEIPKSVEYVLNRNIPEWREAAADVEEIFRADALARELARVRLDDGMP